MNPTEEIIRSRQNRTVVETAKLTDRKARDAGGCFRFDGIKLFEEAIKKGVEIKTVLFRESSRQRIQDEMTYPGQVKITVIRETRSVSYAK